MPRRCKNFVSKILSAKHPTSKKVSPKRALSNKASPKRASPNKASPNKASPKRASPKRALPNRASSKKPAYKEAAANASLTVVKNKIEKFIRNNIRIKKPKKFLQIDIDSNSKDILQVKYDINKYILIFKITILDSFIKRYDFPLHVNLSRGKSKLLRTVPHRVRNVFRFFYRTVFYRDRDFYRTVF